jgi:hypothetical protein
LKGRFGALSFWGHEMTKVADIVKAALQELTVVDEQETPTAEAMRTAIGWLNRMMPRWEANLLALGWSPVTGPDDDLPAPAEAEEAIVLNLALKLRRSYGVPLGDVPDLPSDARAAYATLLRDQEVATPIQPILDAPEPDYYGADRFRSSAWDY